MSARLQPEPQMRVMRWDDLDRVLAVERAAYDFPWTRGNFVDSLAAGYLAEMLVDHRLGLVGYIVAMAGFDEMHLLNLTVAPVQQRRGHARSLLDVLETRCREQGLATLWLEVRASNQRARQIYTRRGFVEVGRRPGYYPAAKSAREDAIVMSLAVGGA